MLTADIIVVYFPITLLAHMFATNIFAHPQEIILAFLFLVAYHDLERRNRSTDDHSDGFIYIIYIYNIYIIL